MSWHWMELTRPYPRVTSWQETCLNPRYPDIPKTDMRGKTAPPSPGRAGKADRLTESTVLASGTWKITSRNAGMVFFYRWSNWWKVLTGFKKLRFEESSTKAKKLIVGSSKFILKMWKIYIYIYNIGESRAAASSAHRTLPLSLRALITRTKTNGTDRTSY